MYCAPAIHWRFEIVGLGETDASGLNSESRVSELEHQLVYQFVRPFSWHQPILPSTSDTEDC